MWQRGGDIKLERLLPIAKLLLKGYHFINQVWR